MPGLTSTSTSTIDASNPTTAALRAFASMALFQYRWPDV
jgi:hypothetical protein